jgi:DMSO/TMAO reductase YedYZ molybdopterin-dependent catalytic subunit
MKLKNSELKFKTAKAFFGGAIFFGLIVFGFIKIKNSSEDSGISSVLRKSLNFNQSIWSSLYSEKTLVPAVKRPPKGQPPRVNGDLGLRSDADIQNYRVEIESGSKKLQLPISAFQALPKAEYATLFKCIEGWSTPIDYGGVRFSDFVKAYQIGSKVDGSMYRYVGFQTPDQEYYVSIDMDSMLNPQTVLAYEMNEAPLSIKNGAPIRLIIPVKYGIKNIKRIGRIYFSDERPPDYWAEEGYDWWAGL